MWQLSSVIAFPFVLLLHSLLKHMNLGKVILFSAECIFHLLHVGCLTCEYVFPLIYKQIYGIGGERL